MNNSEKNTHIAVKAIITRGDKFLAIKRSAYCENEIGEWDLPGGRLEFGETPEEALIREIREEVGMSVTIKKILYTWSFIRNEVNQTVGLTYWVETEDSSPVLSSEHTEFAWVGKNDYEKWGFSQGILRDLKKFNGQY